MQCRNWHEPQWLGSHRNKPLSAGKRRETSAQTRLWGLCGRSTGWNFCLIYLDRGKCPICETNSVQLSGIDDSVSVLACLNGIGTAIALEFESMWCDARLSGDWNVALSIAGKFVLNGKTKWQKNYYIYVRSKNISVYLGHSMWFDGRDETFLLFLFFFNSVVLNVQVMVRVEIIYKLSHA